MRVIVHRNSVVMDAFRCVRQGQHLDERAAILANDTVTVYAGVALHCYVGAERACVYPAFHHKQNASGLA
jgi:hypothetical protein